MTVPSWHEVPIGKTHDWDAFDCGNDDLNDFLRRHARRSHMQGGSKTFLAIDDSDGRILGFYSLAPASIAYERTPEIVRRGLARYDVPGFRLARLAVDRSLRGQGLGGQLLLAAGKRCLLAASEVGGVALVIDAKNESVAGWYASYGALPLLDAPRTPPIPLILPLATIKAALQAVSAKAL
jgi:GNAT superfamily N-acetyltransferase